MKRVRSYFIWATLAAVTIAPLAAAWVSPLLAWRQPVYIIGGFAGVFAMVLLLMQPLLVGGYLPGLHSVRGRHVHFWTGIVLVVMVATHVVALWITSPPDVIDALLFTSPTPFSAWGVLAMWMIFAAALLATLYRRYRLKTPVWRVGHTLLVTGAVIGSVVHALLIEGTMETVSKAVLCALVILATLKLVTERRIWARQLRMMRGNGRKNDI